MHSQSRAMHRTPSEELYRRQRRAARRPLIVGFVVVASAWVTLPRQTSSFVSSPQGFGRYPSIGSAGRHGVGNRLASAIPRLAGLTIDELKAQLRNERVEDSNGDLIPTQLGGYLADVIDRLEKRKAEEETRTGQKFEDIVKEADLPAVAAAPAAPAPVPVVESPANEKAEKLLAELQQVDPRVTKEDYFDPDANTWDVAGLEDDLKLAQDEQGAPSAQAAAPPRPVQENPEAEQMLAQLKELEPKASKEDYYDADAMTWDLEGLRDDLDLAKKEQEEFSANAASAAPPGEDPEALLVQLQKLDPRVEKEDYFDPDASTWDVAGLKDDLKLAQDEKSAAPVASAPPQAPPPTAAAAPPGGPPPTSAAPPPRAPPPSTAAPPPQAPPSAESPETLLTQLQQLDPRASKEDYFDPDANSWDLSGLKDDLKLAKDEHAAAPPTAAAQQATSAETPESLLTQLKALDPRVEKEDYFDPDANQWDTAGLKDDLALAQKEKATAAQPAAPAPAAAAAPAAVAAPQGNADAESMLTQLQKFDPRVSKDDYFDPEAMKWDMDGLVEDLELAKKETAASGGATAGNDAEGMFAELSKLDPRVGRDDYFDSDAGKWDEDGLRDDLELAKKESAGAREAR